MKHFLKIDTRIGNRLKLKSKHIKHTEELNDQINWQLPWKLFTAVLNNRLDIFCEDFKIIQENQARFRHKIFYH